MLIAEIYVVSKSQWGGHRNNIGPCKFRSPTSETQSHYDFQVRFWIRLQANWIRLRRIPGEFNSPGANWETPSIWRRFESPEQFRKILRERDALMSDLPVWIHRISSFSMNSGVFSDANFSTVMTRNPNKSNENPYKQTYFSAMVSRHYRCSEGLNLMFMMLLMCPNHRIIQITFFCVKLCILNSPRIRLEFASRRIQWLFKTRMAVIYFTGLCLSPVSQWSSNDHFETLHHRNARRDICGRELWIFNPLMIDLNSLTGGFKCFTRTDLRSKVARREVSPEWWCASPESDDVRKRHKIWIILWPRSISDLEPNVSLGSFFAQKLDPKRSGRTETGDGRTHGHTWFLEPPLHNKPFGQ